MNLLAGIGAAARAVDAQHYCTQVVVLMHLLDGLQHVGVYDAFTRTRIDLTLQIEDTDLILGRRGGFLYISHLAGREEFVFLGLA